ncbi:MAG: hypothetical protein GTN76_12465 [Candidatus Aenigmarchaeota archaeon]|nr:hypothetical protein [Candidatus Aenigmarchaeota archaeon]
MMKYIYKAIDFLKSPEKSFDSIKGEKLGEAFKFMLVVAIVFAVLNGIVSGLIANFFSTGFGMTGAVLLPVVIVGAIVGGYIGIIIFLTIWGLWLHLWAYVFGARKGLEQTMKSVYYGYSPAYLLGWLPVISIIFGIWALVLQWMGIRKLHGMTGGSAALALIIAIVIPVIIAAVAFMTLLAAFLPMTGIGTLGGLSGLGVT